MKLIRRLGLTAIAAVAGLVGYLYITDTEVKDTTDRAIDAVGDAVKAVIVGKSSSSQDVYEVRLNQQSTEEQWEQLGM